ncbi:hypothetical protein ACLOJK_035068 [Asimina triloba]
MDDVVVTAAFWLMQAVAETSASAVRTRDIVMGGPDRVMGGWPNDAGVVSSTCSSSWRASASLDGDRGGRRRRKHMKVPSVGMVQGV